ncbi:MAG: glycosyltransferase family 4 protein [Candidatus Yanofskybacteria bacterium]|nr:glycosyltransferase family 4 protein [Candidatus Yanofskybacteria bacterium]
MYKIGIECENLEDPKSRWGVGHLVLNLLQEYAKNPEWQKRFQLFLYFKERVPDDEVLKNPVFVKKVLGTRSFNIFYHILLPIRATFDGIDMMFFPAYMLPPLYLRKATVMFTEDVFHEYKTGTLPFRYKLAYGLFTNWAAKKAAKILAISEASKKQVSKLYGIKPDRITVAHLGVKEPSTAESASQYGNYILYVGQMFPRRRAVESIKAFEKIAPEFPALNFVLVGKDKYNPHRIAGLVAEINKKLGKERVFHFEYINNDKDLEKLYNGAKLFAYISSSEAFGLPPVEAAAHGVPVVVKDSELNHELFGNAAFFVADEKDPENIANVFRQGLTDELRRGKLMREYKELTPKLSWENFAQKFFSSISSL